MSGANTGKNCSSFHIKKVFFLGKKVTIAVFQKKMGKRKKSTPKVQRRFYRIPKFFACPICNAEDSIAITLSHQTRRAQLQCKKCGEKVTDIQITPITEAIDVYNDWLDAVKEQNKNYNEGTIPEDTSYIADDEIIMEENRLQQSKKQKPRHNTSSPQSASDNSSSDVSGSDSNSSDSSSELSDDD